MQRRSVLLALGGFALAAPLLGACASKGSKSKDSPVGEAFGGTQLTDIVTQLKRMPEFQQLSLFIKRAGLEGLLAGPGPYTLLAPNDNAIGSSLRQGQIAALGRPENKAQLVELVKNHVVAGRINDTTLRETRTLRNLAGRELRIDRHGKQVEIGTADLVRTNIGATNGYIHEIDEVLMLPDNSNLKSFN